MYRLMIVTKSDKTVNFFDSFPEWLQNGFKRPHYRESIETLKEGLNKHHVDAIAIDLENSNERDLVINFLNEEYPLLPIFNINFDIDEQKVIFSRLCRCLDKINEDISDDELSYEQRFEAVRNRWLSKYMRGKLTSYDEFLDKNKIYRANYNINSPCILAKLSIESDEYFESKWRYGADRLEVAIRNFLIPDSDNVNITIAVDDGICSILFSNLESVANKNEIIEYAKTFINKATSEINEYLGLKLKIEDIYYFNNHKEYFYNTKNS